MIMITDFHANIYDYWLWLLISMPTFMIIDYDDWLKFLGIMIMISDWWLKAPGIVIVIHDLLPWGQPWLSRKCGW